MKKFRFEYFASCPTGLEELLNKEIMALGAKTTAIARGGVKFESFHEIALKVILYSRFASRVFKFLYEFEVQNEKDYYLEATDIKWKSLMSVGQTFRLTTILGDLPGEREEFRNSQFANLKLKDAIVDYFRHYDGERPSVERDYPDVAFLARIDHGTEKPYKVTLLYDLCGEPISHRGYRVARTPAPIRENLAAGVIEILGWNPETEGFLDGMCGSGTILIEAALKAAGIAPSFLRVEGHLKNPNVKLWTFLNYPWFTEDKHLQENFQKYVTEIVEATKTGLEKLKKYKGKIVGNDNNPESIYAVRENLKKAKLDSVIEITQFDATQMKPLPEKCLFVANPPYGERLEFNEEERLKVLYKSLGDNWKHEFKGHRAAIITGNLPMLKQVGLRTSKRHILFNGDIECRLAEYSLY